MNYEEFASDLPLDRTIVFRSVEENEETMRRLGVTQEMRQLGKGQFRCDMAVRKTQQADLFADRFNKGVTMYLEPPAGTVGFLFPRNAGNDFLACGEEVANAKLIVIPNGSGVDIVAGDLFGSEAFLITQSRLNELTETLCPTCVAPDRMTVIEGNPTELHALRNTVLGLVTHQEWDPHGEQVSDLVAQTIAWMGHSSNQWRPEGLMGNGIRIRVAKRAQEFIEEHYNEGVHVEDLCRATGVGVRTLQRGFKEYFDITISDYLKTVRLDAARRELVAAHPSQTSVASIALRHGFTHLGRFSVEFRERFGKLPKETLAMRVDRKS